MRRPLSDVASRRSRLQSGPLRTMAIQGGTAMQLPGRQGFASTPTNAIGPADPSLSAHRGKLIRSSRASWHSRVNHYLHHVHREFEAYLKCGRLEHGFLRVRCDKCHFERLVAFSCKKRGFCPSCGARRMAETAALLADEVMSLFASGSSASPFLCATCLRPTPRLWARCWASFTGLSPPT
jgi:ribosomal protein S27E